MKHFIYIIFTLCIATTVLFTMEKPRETGTKQPPKIIVTTPEGIVLATTDIIREAMKMAADILKLQNPDDIKEKIEGFEKKYEKYIEIKTIQLIRNQLYTHLQQNIKS